MAKKIVGKKLRGRKIAKVRRRAKLLIIDFTDNSSMLLHLKLTGQLIFEGKPSLYTRHIFKFEDGTRLIFNDARKFGWWKIVNNSKEIEKTFGPEALEISFKRFKTILSKRPNSKIKPLLMDQKAIAGIGNIYSDEILYRAKVHPLRRARTLRHQESRRIFNNINRVLRSAIKQRGSSVEYYIDALGKQGDYVKYHKVYKREGKACKRCGLKIERIKIGGRSARYCPKCQKRW